MSGNRKVNSIELKEGVIYYKQVGDQDKESAIKSVQAIRLLSTNLPRILIFADYRDSGKMDTESLKSGWYAFRNMNFHKVAIMGASPYLITLLNTMARATGKSKKLHFVKSRDAAIEWLNR